MFLNRIKKNYITFQTLQKSRSALFMFLLLFYLHGMVDFRAVFGCGVRCSFAKTNSNSQLIRRYFLYKYIYRVADAVM